MRTTRELEGVRSFRPELADAIENYQRLAAEKLDPALAELYRLRFAQIHQGVEGPMEATARTRAAGITDGQLRDLWCWIDSDQFDDRQKACLEMADFFCHTALSVTDEHVEEVGRYLSPEQIVTLASGYWVSDAAGRLDNFLNSLGVAN